MPGTLRLPPGIIPDTRGIFFAALRYRSPFTFLFSLCDFAPCRRSPLPAASCEAGPACSLVRGQAFARLCADRVFCLFPRARSGLLVSSCEDKPKCRLRAVGVFACFLVRGQAHLLPQARTSPAWLCANRAPVYFLGRGSDPLVFSCEDKPCAAPCGWSFPVSSSEDQAYLFLSRG